MLYAFLYINWKRLTSIKSSGNGRNIAEKMALNGNFAEKGYKTSLKMIGNQNLAGHYKSLRGDLFRFIQGPPYHPTVETVAGSTGGSAPAV